ncbi:c-type cytochrome [Sphingomonas montanisoli]|uniref:Cytochrome c family protein n=1 Tax=Sphingomonas montanisoli TaxID=2606412 RepID=A0A5D9C4M2_9SPHN|nr:cytochrome c family protein [Sphingomonas montanisoli]TZG24971.1 cytochrome c family protein [Sphingomonas montanisoli]
MRIGGVILGALALATSSGAMAAGDAAKGKSFFVRCAVCHKTVAGQNGIGPSLAGVSGRKAGTLAGFNYSPAMKGANFAWTQANLDAYLTKPMAKVPGTRMIFMGVPKAEDRENLIAYLATLK